MIHPMQPTQARLMRYPKTITKQRAGGFVLIAALIMLIVLTFLAIGMYHSFTIQENVTANTKEKGRAFQVAQSTLEYAEHELQSGALLTPSNPTGSPVACASGTPLTTATICNHSSPVNILEPTASSAMRLANGATYSTMMPALTLSQTGGNGTYYANPQFYIEYLGNNQSTGQYVYQVTALGYGGTPSAVAVVQSTYQVGNGTKCLSCSL